MGQKFKDEIIFAGSGLDVDSNHHFLKKGDTDERYNLVPSIGGNNHVLSAIKGNYEITHGLDAFDEFTNPVVRGSCFDSANNRHYYFVCDDNGSQGIFRYNVDDETAESVLAPVDIGAYGLLYNWLAVNNAHGLAPDGWHVPTATEFDAMVTYLGGVGVAGKYIKEEGTRHWRSDTGVTNSSGLSVIGCGYRNYDTGAFVETYWLGTVAYMWTSTEYDGTRAKMRYAWSNNNSINSSNVNKLLGCSVRCIKDSIIGWEEGDTVTDVDGNIYDTVLINDQVWMVQNLMTTKYKDGYDIDYIAEDADWIAASDGAYCKYQNSDFYVWQKHTFTQLGIDLADTIDDAFVIDDYLFWNPKTSSPRMVNIEWAINSINHLERELHATYDSGDTYSYHGWIFDVTSSETIGEDSLIDDIDNQTFALCEDSGDRFYYYYDEGNEYLDTVDRPFYNYADQPYSKPTFAFGNDTNINYNNLKDGVFQFAYRFVYADGRVSLYSPYSEVASQASSEDLYGELLGYMQYGNKITVSVVAPYNKNEMERIEIVYRMATDEGWGYWYYAGEVNKLMLFQDNDVSFDFYNNFAADIVDQDEVLIEYSALPKLADAQTSLMNNRVAYAGVTEGFDNITTDVTMTADFSEISPSFGGTLEEECIISEITHTDGSPYLGWWQTLYYRVIEIETVPGSGDVFVININSDTLTYLVPGVIDEDELKQALVILLTDAGYTNVMDDDEYYALYDEEVGVTSVLILDGQAENGGARENRQVDYLYAASYSTPTYAYSKLSGFKTGAVHPFCIYYYDELMRRSDPMICQDEYGADTMRVYLPFITEQDITNAGYIYKYTIDWQIDHEPPSWAKYWRFGYAGNASVGYFVQYSVVSATVADGFTNIDITSLQTITTATGAGYMSPTLENSNIPAYSFTKGDRVRLITPKADGSADIVAPFQCDEYYYYDYEIISFDDENSVISIVELDLGTGPTQIDLGAGSIIEIYRPKRDEQSTIYYEYGTLYEVREDDNGLYYHKGDTQDQAWDTDEYGTDLPATGTLSKGDIYHMLRLFSYEITTDGDPYPVESYSASDFYDSEVWAQGKIGSVTNIGEKKLNNIRYSDPLIQDTKINGLSSFQYDNYITINRKHGDITAMREAGHTLKILQRSNSASVGVGRTEYEDATGTSYLVQSDKILGVERISTSGHGCINPESVLQAGSYLYWFDAMRGCMIRDAGGGAFPISGRYVSPEGVADYKMEQFFQYHAKKARAGDCSVFTAWDEENKLLFVYFKYDKSEYEDGGFYYENYGTPYTTLDSGATGDECVVFHEPSNRWVSYVTLYGMDLISSGANSLISFSGDKILVHNHDSAEYCTFDGTNYGCGTMVYSSENNNINKLFHAIAIHADTKPRLETIKVYTQEVNDGFMVSKIFYKLIKKIEGIFRAYFLRNGWLGGVLKTHKLYRGDFLRGKVIKVFVTYDGTFDEYGDPLDDTTTGINLFKVDIESEIHDY